MAKTSQKELFDKVMKKEWTEVVKMYKQNLGLHTAKITSSGDTALHIAVSEGSVDMVEQLIKVLDSKGMKDALNIQNEHGNTPLHLAAAMGNRAMCKCIIEVDESLVDKRNEDSHTPLFLTALHGKKEAFIFLLEICEQQGIKRYYRGKSGETILHCAINGEYFELAILILERHEELVAYMNERGMSPFHLLASKPQIFRSCTYFTWLERIIYSCITVKMLLPEQDQIMNQIGQESRNIEAPSVQQFPSNYSTCCDFLNFSHSRATGENAKNSGSMRDAENPNEDNAKRHGQAGLEGNTKELPQGQESRNIEAPSVQQFPSNYSTCRDFLNRIYHVLLVFYGWVSNSRATGENAKNSGSMRDAENPNGDNAKRHGQAGLEGNTKELPQGAENPKQDQHEGQCACISGAENPKRDQHEGEGPQKFPPNYRTCFELMKLVYKLTLVILGLGYSDIQKIKDVKEKHVWSVHILEKMLKSTKIYEYDAAGRSGSESQEEETSVTKALESPNGETNQNTIEAKNNGLDKTDKTAMKIDRKETPLLTAAKNGIKEIVESILEHFPVAIHDTNSEKKNVLLLAVENRQPSLYDLLKQKYNNESVFHAVDIEGNNILHLAANYNKSMNPWIIRGAALQMKWEIKWYEHVKSSMPPNLMLYNNAGKTAVEIFTNTHEELVEQGGKWLYKTSSSCSVVAALIASVAFTTTGNVPGGVEKGKPVHGKELAFQVFSISSLISLCCSVTSLVIFLGILTSRYRENEFKTALPTKLLGGLSLLLISIAAILVSFCAGHFFIVDDQFRSVAVPIYAVTCLPAAAIFALGHLPLYMDLICAILMKVPTIFYNGRYTPLGSET
ncbi:uncharacterized protein LOC117925188 isoform X2 [Vitis riparia]|uniref:uncharacterized protein LOC117925188 isoform X2 n=1 Tax=Vitis riparia TaxID=96939 RepID=UPI00155B164C|nr:uncharacterized protein LOC117925188 isoform X2 [Vitis riparia]